MKGGDSYMELDPRTLVRLSTRIQRTFRIQKTASRSSLRRWKRRGFLAFPHGNRWLAYLLISWMIYDPQSFSLKEVLLLSDVQSRQERLATQRNATNQDQLLEAILAMSLKIVALPGFQQLLADEDPRVMNPLFRAGASGILEEPRIWLSKLRQYLLLEQQGLLIPIYAPEGGIDSFKNPKPPRIRGYTDHGSRRPAERWLPSPPSEKDEDPNTKPDELARLEDFLFHPEE